LSSITALAEETLLEGDEGSNGPLSPVVSVSASVADGLVNGLALLLGHLAALLLVAGLVGGLVCCTALLLVTCTAFLGWD